MRTPNNYIDGTLYVMRCVSVLCKRKRMVIAAMNPLENNSEAETRFSCQRSADTPLCRKDKTELHTSRVSPRDKRNKSAARTLPIADANLYKRVSSDPPALAGFRLRLRLRLGAFVMSSSIRHGAFVMSSPIVILHSEIETVALENGTVEAPKFSNVH